MFIHVWIKHKFFIVKAENQFGLGNLLSEETACYNNLDYKVVSNLV